VVRLLGRGDELPLGLGSRCTGGHSAGRPIMGQADALVGTEPMRASVHPCADALSHLLRLGIDSDWQKLYIVLHRPYLNGVHE